MHGCAAHGECRENVLAENGEFEAVLALELDGVPGSWYIPYDVRVFDAVSLGYIPIWDVWCVCCDADDGMSKGGGGLCVWPFCACIFSSALPREGAKTLTKYIVESGNLRRLESYSPRSYGLEGICRRPRSGRRRAFRSSS